MRQEMGGGGWKELQYGSWRGWVVRADSDEGWEVKTGDDEKVGAEWGPSREVVALEGLEVAAWTLEIFG